MNTKAICTVTLFYYQNLKAVTGLYWMRLVFSIVSLFPRENIHLNRKAFWQSILVLVVKLRHRVNDLFSSKLVHEFKLMSSSVDNVEGSQKFIWKNATSSSCFCNHISIIPRGSTFRMWTNCSGTILVWAILREEEKSKKKREKLKSCWIFPSFKQQVISRWWLQQLQKARAKMKNARAMRKWKTHVQSV